MNQKSIKIAFFHAGSTGSYLEGNWTVSNYILECQTHQLAIVLKNVNLEIIETSNVEFELNIAEITHYFKAKTPDIAKKSFYLIALLCLFFFAFFFEWI